MVYKEHGKTMSVLNKLFFDLLHDKSLNKADILWSNSLYTKEGIQKYFPERKCKEIFVGFFINTDLFRPIQVTAVEKNALLAKYKIKNKFILFVGTLEPRKNLEFLLSLMPELAAEGYYLLVVGAKGWGKSNIKSILEKEHFPQDNVVFPGFITTDELIKIFNIASVFVSTSLNEGFGMPQLEAMACGCPVISPHNSAMIEVVEGAGETVKTWIPKDWVEKINKVNNNRSIYIQKGFERVKEYQKEKIMNQFIDYVNNQMSKI